MIKSNRLKSRDVVHYVKGVLLFLLALVLLGCGKVKLKDIKVDEAAVHRMYEIENLAVTSITKRTIEQLPYATTLIVKPGDEKENNGLAKLVISNLDLGYTAFLGIRAFKLLNDKFLFTHLFKGEDGRWVENSESGQYYIDGGKNFFIKGTSLSNKEIKLFTIDDFHSTFTFRDVIFEDDTMSRGTYRIKNDRISIVIPFSINYNRGIVVKPDPVEDIKIEVISKSENILEFDSEDFHLINAFTMGVEEGIYNSTKSAALTMSFRRILDSSFDGLYEPFYPSSLKYIEK